MSMNQPWSRRKFLRGLGVCAALPTFESLRAANAWAAPQTSANIAAATTPAGVPLRMLFCYVPNGVNVAQWTPEGDGANYKLSPTLQALQDHRSELQVISGLAQQNGTSGGDGAGDHARANATILTGVRPRKTAGADIHLGVSVDQVAAQHVGRATRFPSLELSCDGARKSGSCDSGYSCAYQFNISWRTPNSPMAPESNPRLVFERLFGSGEGPDRKQGYQERRRQKRSILDFAADDAVNLRKSLGGHDRQKLDEYLTGVREIERRILDAERFGEPPDPGVNAPEGVPASYAEHVRLMNDMLVLAFQTDSTRIATFLMAHDGSNRTFEDIGVTDGHHSLSHHQDDPEKLEKIARIDRFYVEQFAHLLGRLRAAKDADGRTILDNSMVVYASGLSDGNRHKHDNLPVILAGRAGGKLSPGKRLIVPEQTAMSNLYVSMLNTALESARVKLDQFGDSTGALAGI